MVLLACLGIFSAGCSSTSEVDQNTAAGRFQVAEELDKDERFEEALTKYAEVRNKFPYSKFAVEAELKQADIYFKREQFPEAQTAYQLFKDFHPKHPRNDYVTYRIAMSYFGDIPPTIDRDISPAFKAIEVFNEVISRYGSSKYAKEAREKKADCLRMLAEKEGYIGNFYFIRDRYEPALRRYEGLLKRYPNSALTEQALYRAGVSAFKIGKKDIGSKHLKNLIARFPQGKFYKKGKEALQEYGGS